MALTQVPLSMIDLPTISDPIVTKFVITGTTTGYLFTANAPVNVNQGDVYTTPNGSTFTVLYTLTNTTLVWMDGAVAPNTAPDDLTISTGTGTSPITYDAFQTLATFIPSANTKYFKVRMVGAGGGGAGVNTHSSNPQDGQNTTFNSDLIAGGGKAPTILPTSITAGNGGFGGTFTIASGIAGFGLNGGGGGAGTSVPSMPFAGGVGGSSVFGGGGASCVYNGGPGTANTGGGGAGGGYPSGNAGGGGGSGAYIEAVYANTSPSYTYSVGQGGDGGVALSNGGPGGSGVIIIEEYSV
jgi:hypothetical protein